MGKRKMEESTERIESTKHSLLGMRYIDGEEKERRENKENEDYVTFIIGNEIDEEEKERREDRENEKYSTFLTRRAIRKMRAELKKKRGKRERRVRHVPYWE